MKIKSARYYLVLPFFVLYLVGCTGLSKVGNTIDKGVATVVPFYDFNKTLLSSIKITSTANSNHNLPVAVDIVFVLDDDTAKVLSKLSGPDWFANKPALILQYQHQLTLSELEVVPHTATQEVLLPDDYFKAVRVFLYANYLAQAGQYQADITQYRDLNITLQEHGYVLQGSSFWESLL